MTMRASALAVVLSAMIAATESAAHDLSASIESFLSGANPVSRAGGKSAMLRRRPETYPLQE